MGPDLHGLGQIGEPEAHFLGVLSLSSFLGHLHHQDLLLIFGHLLGFSKASLHARREVDGLSEGKPLFLIGIGDGEVGLQGKDSSGRQHL